MGAEHAYCYGQMADAAVTKVFSRDRGKAAAAADQLGAESTNDALALIGDPAIDAIDICLPTPIHSEFVIASLEAGKHVFCETPLSLDPAEGERMRAAARRAGRLLQVGLLMRSIAACRFVKQAADSGEYGQLIHVAAHRLGSYLRADAPDHKDHYSDPTTELMTFDLDFVGWLLGRPTTVAAVGGAWRGLDGDVSAHLGFKGGRAATVLASGIMPPSFPFTTGFRAVFENAVIVSETVIRDGAFSSATHLFQSRAATQPELPRSNPYQVELEHFVRCVRGAADVELLDVDRALEALALSRAIQECLRSRASIASTN